MFLILNCGIYAALNMSLEHVANIPPLARGSTSFSLVRSTAMSIGSDLGLAIGCDSTSAAASSDLGLATGGDSTSAASSDLGSATGCDSTSSAASSSSSTVHVETSRMKAAGLRGNSKVFVDLMAILQRL